MNKYRLIIDSSCDIPEKLIADYSITTTDLIINFPDKAYRDRKDISVKELLKICETTKVFPKTSALNIPELMDVFAYELKTSEHIFYLPISSSISSLNNNAHLAARELDMEKRITILDSKSLSSGIGLELLGIERDMKAGLSPEVIEKNHYDRQKKISMSFVIDTMDFLYKGGRCGGLTYLLGNKLHLHPIIRLDNGKMSVHKLSRGKDTLKAIKEMVTEFKKNLDSGNIDLNYPIMIPNVEASASVRHITRELADLVGDKILFPIDASGIICCHCGRNTLGLAYMLKKPMN